MQYQNHILCTFSMIIPPITIHTTPIIAIMLMNPTTPTIISITDDILLLHTCLHVITLSFQFFTAQVEHSQNLKTSVNFFFFRMAYCRVAIRCLSLTLRMTLEWFTFSSFEYISIGVSLV